jgi:hypothetical protein
MTMVCSAKNCGTFVGSIECTLVGEAVGRVQAYALTQELQPDVILLNLHFLSLPTLVRPRV